MSSAPTPASARMLRPIILGGDVGSYATARAFHEAYGVVTTIVAGVRIGPVADSAIVDLRVEANLEDDEVFLATIRSIMAEHPGDDHLILASVDWWVSKLVEHAEALAPAIVPYANAAIIDLVTDKAAFSRLCTELDIPQPRTLIMRPGDDLPPDLPIPMVVKAASSGAFHSVEFAGKRKVEFFDSPNQLQRYFEKVAAAGFTGEFVVQEHLPGGDDTMAAVNCFYGPDGSAHLFVYGRVLLEERTPNGLGNSVAQITGRPEGRSSIAAARRLLDHLGWTGFANFDLKQDAAGQFRFLELNPRVGRSGYAVTAAGHNVADMYVRAFVEGQPAPAEATVSTSEHLFVVVPLRLLKKYAPAWLDTIHALKRRGAVTNPYYYRRERHPRRWFYVVSAMANQFRKFAQHS